MSNLPDYLRKYVEGPVEQETTKKKKKKSKGPVKKIEGLKIVDETVEVKPVIKEEEEEEEPTVVEIGFRHRELLGEVMDYNPKIVRKEDVDLSPQRKRHDSDDDLDVPRKRTQSTKQDKNDNDVSPPRRRHDSDNDLSPPRKKDDSDVSPPRKTKEDASPPRRKRHDNDNDLSPPRKEETKPTESVKPPVATLKMSSGGKAGLIHATEISKEEAERKRKRHEKLAKLDPREMGKDSAVVYRDKQGKKRSVTDLVKQDKGIYLEDDEANMEWGKGLVQKKEKEDEQAYIEREKLKPFIRTAEDQDLNADLKSKERWGDPMLALMNEDEEAPKSKKSKKDKNAKKSKKEKKKELRWKGVAAATNRFGILPGKYWDGVDRSNGFEHKLLSRESESMARQEEAYLWSVEDM